MGKTTGFMEYSRVSSSKRDPLQRIKDYNEQIIMQNETTLREQAARCMNCGIPFCHSGITLNNMTSGCPLHNYIPDFNEYVYKGKWKDAYLKLIETNPFPEFTGRVCPAPCEGACTNGLHSQSVAIKDIEHSIIENAFKYGYVEPYTGLKNGKTVAVIGSGPAGLSAAHFLAHLGYEVTVYEKQQEVGGLLYYGIPEMKLEKSIIKRRLSILEQSGVTFVVNHEVTAQNYEDLQRQNDAIVLAIGSEKPRDLLIESRELKNIHFAMDFLKNSIDHLHKDKPLSINAKDKKVLIIGGGDTATDCLATSIRQGAKSITQLEIMPKKDKNRNQNINPWPEYPNILKTDYGQVEAIELFNQDPRAYLKTVTKFNGKDIVTSVEVADVTWNGNIASFSKKTTTIETDLIIIAIGFTGPNKELINALNIDYDSSKHNHLENCFDTSIDNLFIAGDARRGQSLVVTALEEGKQVALQIHDYLQN